MTMSKRREHNKIRTIRIKVEVELGLITRMTSSPKEFWDFAEQKGKLVEAVDLFNRLEAERKAWARVPRETKEEFARRIAQEGRQEQADQLRAELLASGLSKREVQVELVAQMQPLDGRKTRAQETPDPWLNGRLFRKKADHEKLVEKANGGDFDYDDFDEDDEQDDDVDQAEAKARLKAAGDRLEERVALAAARKRARVLQARRPASASKGPSAQASPPIAPSKPPAEERAQQQSVRVLEMPPDMVAPEEKIPQSMLPRERWWES
jgi:hypothetical protein